MWSYIWLREGTECQEELVREWTYELVDRTPTRRDVINLLNTFFQLTVLICSSSISGAIQPSVPAAPDRREKDSRPAASFLQSPKSEIMARTAPRELGWEMRTLWGFTSRCTANANTSTGQQ